MKTLKILSIFICLFYIRIQCIGQTKQIDSMKIMYDDFRDPSPFIAVTPKSFDTFTLRSVILTNSDTINSVSNEISNFYKDSSYTDDNYPDTRARIILYRKSYVDTIYMGCTDGGPVIYNNRLLLSKYNFRDVIYNIIKSRDENFY